jgi:hypothetical protein
VGRVWRQEARGADRPLDTYELSLAVTYFREISLAPPAAVSSAVRHMAASVVFRETASLNWEIRLALDLPCRQVGSWK